MVCYNHEGPAYDVNGREGPGLDMPYKCWRGGEKPTNSWDEMCYAADCGKLIF